MESTRPDRRRSQTRTYDRSSSVVFRKTRETFGGLSNMAGGFPLMVSGVRIRTSEALYQACRFPHLPEVQRLIIAQRSPMTAKMKGKPYRQKSRRDWNRVRVNVMRWCLRVKLAQNWAVFSKLLLDTGFRPIVEQSRKDDFWGAMPVDDQTLVGMNILGRLLMELRESVKTETEERLLQVEPPHITDFLLEGCPIEPVIGGTPKQGTAGDKRPSRALQIRLPETAAIELPLTQAKVKAPTFREDSALYAADLSSGNLRPYPVHRDVGVKWLGALPEHWDMRRLRNAVTMRVSNVDKHVREGETPVRLCNYVDVYKHDCISQRIDFMRATATLEEIAQFRLEEGDVLITKDSETWDDIGVPAVVTEPAEDLISGYHLALLRPFANVLVGAYLLRALQSKGLAHQFHVEAKGVTRFGLSHVGIKSVWLAVPPLHEQDAIVRFLDHADRRIRRYTRAKQKLIALLEEQKQAIIHQAVTGRIDVRTGQPYPAYKPSGVEWLGDVPEHWEKRRLKTVLRPVDRRSATGTETLLSLRRDHGVVVYAEHFSRPPQGRTLVGFKLVRSGQLVVNRLQANNGLVFCSHVDGLVSPDYSVFEARRPLEMQFLSDLLRTADYRSHFRRESTGLGTGTAGFLRLYDGDFLETVVFLPSVQEQILILQALSDEMATNGRLVRNQQEELELFEEYRARLIADVVTGKLDVREAAAGLPEVDPLPAEDDLIDGADHDTGSQRTRWRHGEAEGRAVADVPVAERRGRGQ